MLGEGVGAFIAAVCAAATLALLAADPGIGIGMLALCALCVITSVCVWSAAGARNASVGYRVAAAAAALALVALVLVNASSLSMLYIPAVAAAAATVRQRSRWWLLTSLVVATSFVAVALTA